MKVVSLFSGCGGLDLGLQQAGHQIILQCECNPGAQQVLRKHFPGVLLVPEIGALSSLPPDTEVVTAGFPCTDVSRSGLRRGLQGQATGAVRHVFRLLRAAQAKHRPVPWVLMENVEALLDRVAGQPPLMQYIADSLEELGYNWAQRIISTAGFGIPHKRRRVFIVASMFADPRDVLLSQGAEYCRGACLLLYNGQACHSCHEADADPQPGLLPPTYAIDLANAQSAAPLDLVPTLKTGNNKICILTADGGAGLLRLEDAERLQGFPEGYTAECYPVVPMGVSASRVQPLQDTHLKHGQADRWALLGNAVSVPLARFLGDCLAAPHRHKYISGPADAPLPRLSRSPEPLDSPAGRRSGSPSRGDEGHVRIQVPDEALAAERDGTAGSEGSHHVEPDGAVEEEDVEILTEDELDTDFQPPNSEGRAGCNVDRNLQRNNSEGRAGGNVGGEAGCDSWPRAAWFVKGLGRHSVKLMSDSPVIQPLIPLGSFIRRLGAPVEHAALATYLARMREQGWLVTPTVTRMLECGQELLPEATRVVRLRGSVKDGETLGPLVWCAFHARGGGAPVWWPAEMLDPFHLPPTRSLPLGAAAALSLEEFRASIPRRGGGVLPPPPAVPGQEELPEEDAGSVSQQGNAMRSKLRSASDISPRRVCVLFFGDGRCMWAPPAKLLPYKRYQHEKEMEGLDVRDALRLPNPKLFRTALQEAREAAGLQVREELGADIVTGEEVAAFAARRAKAANLAPRCARCHACTSAAQAVGKRCLAVRCAAAAAAGHSGAQLALYGERALGARLQVWWPADEAWYPGTVTDFDRMGWQHRVEYDDGDVEIIPLWAPAQLVRALTEPKEWAEEALRLQPRPPAASVPQAKARARVDAPREEADEEEQPPGPLTALEQQRAANIARNQQCLSQLRRGVAIPGNAGVAIPGNAGVAIPGNARVATRGNARVAIPGTARDAIPGNAGVAIPGNAMPSPATIPVGPETPMCGDPGVPAAACRLPQKSHLPVRRSLRPRYATTAPLAVQPCGGPKRAARKENRHAPLAVQPCGGPKRAARKENRHAPLAVQPRSSPKRAALKKKDMRAGVLRTRIMEVLGLDVRLGLRTRRAPLPYEAGGLSCLPGVAKAPPPPPPPPTPAPGGSVGVPVTGRGSSERIPNQQ
eukprot:jgi/Botrbrau1/5706/Bobra.0071s0038.1